MRHVLAAVAVPVIAVMAVTGCNPGDPRVEVLKQRARWSVELTSWIPKDDANVSVGIRLSGPPNTTLEQFTFRISQLDVNEQTLLDTWQTIDTADVPRGGPKDLLISLPDPGAVVESVGIGMAGNPTPEEESNIPELQF